MDSEASGSFLRVQVVGMFLHSLAFGIYLVTCGYCFRAFFTTRSRQGISETLLLAVFLMFFAKITASVILHLDLSLRTIGTHSSMMAAMQFMDGSDPINIFKVFHTAIRWSWTHNRTPLVNHSPYPNRHYEWCACAQVSFVLYFISLVVRYIVAGLSMAGAGSS